MMDKAATIHYIEQSRKGDSKARDKLVEENLPLVWDITRRFHNRGQDAEDLFQIGCIGLIKAIDHFDTRYDVCFSTYAVPKIMGEIRRFLRDDGMIKVSRRLKEVGMKIARAKESLQAEMGREVSLYELQAATGCEMDEILMALEANARVDSMQRSIGGEDGREIYLEDRLPEKGDAHEALLNHLCLEQLMEQLDETEQELIRRRYFSNQTQVAVARAMGISQVKVSRMEKKILSWMRREWDR